MIMHKLTFAFLFFLFFFIYSWPFLRFSTPFNLSPKILYPFQSQSSHLRAYIFITWMATSEILYPFQSQIVELNFYIYIFLTLIQYVYISFLHYTTSSGFIHISIQTLSQLIFQLIFQYFHKHYIHIYYTTLGGLPIKCTNITIHHTYILLTIQWYHNNTYIFIMLFPILINLAIKVAITNQNS